MPLYEAVLVLRSLPRPELASSLERLLSHLYTHNDAFLHRIRFLGHRQLPQRTRSVCEPEGQLESTGNYFVLETDLTVDGKTRWLKECGREPHVLLRHVVAMDKLEQEQREQVDVEACSTLDPEFRAPATRPSVQKLVEQGRKKPRFSLIYQTKTGLGYGAFSK